MPSPDYLRRCAEALGVEFADLELLGRALTHGSVAKERGVESNERLEFLGDAVLELVASEWLYLERSQEAEGLLTQRRSRLVSSVALAELARRIDLGRWVVLSVGEERSNGRSKRSVLANTFEALLGAIYLDAGLAAAQAWVLPQLQGLDTEVAEGDLPDAKNRLQEHLQARGLGLPVYTVVEEDGPAHARTFLVECSFAEGTVTRGSGSSKRRAERRAAGEALSAIERR